jgi:hypothetical protein
MYKYLAIFLLSIIIIFYDYICVLIYKKSHHIAIENAIRKIDKRNIQIKYIFDKSTLVAATNLVDNKPFYYINVTQDSFLTAELIAYHEYMHQNMYPKKYSKRVEEAIVGIGTYYYSMVEYDTAMQRQCLLASYPAFEKLTKIEKDTVLAYNYYNYTHTFIQSN